MIYQNQLANGIRVIAMPYNTLRSVSIGIWIRTGPVNENLENNGVSHFIEHLLFKGTPKRSAKEIAIEIDEIGGELNAYTSRECVCLYTEVLDIHFERAVDIMADMLQHSNFEHQEIEREKTVILDEIGMYEDSPEDVVDEMLHAQVFNGTTLAQSILGTQESVSAMTQDKINNFFNTYVTPDNIVISACGNFDPTTLHALLSQYFSTMRSCVSDNKENETCEKNIPIYKNVFTPGLTYKRKNIELNHFSFALPGLPYKSNKLYPYLIMNTLIGGSVSSRLFQNIRENNGLTYTIETSPVFYSETGYLSLYFTTVTDHIPKLTELLSKEIEMIRTVGFSEDELHRAKNQMISSYLLGLEYSGDIMNWLGKVVLFDDAIREKDEVISLIEKTSLESVNTLAKEIFSTNELALAVVGKGTKKAAKDMYNAVRHVMR